MMRLINLGLFFYLLLSALPLSAVEIDLPPETATYRVSDLPGCKLVQKNCVVCHSAQYVSSQPPTSPRSYWDATVHKMKKAFAAPIPEEDIPETVDYLVKIYGAEKPEKMK